MRGGQLCSFGTLQAPSAQSEMHSTNRKTSSERESHAIASEASIQSSPLGNRRRHPLASEGKLRPRS